MGTTPKRGVLGTGTTRKKVGRRNCSCKKDDYSDRLKKRGLTLRRGSGSKRGVLGTGQARKRGVLGTGQVKKGGIFTAAHTCTGHICECLHNPHPQGGGGGSSEQYCVWTLL